MSQLRGLANSAVFFEPGIRHTTWEMPLFKRHCFENWLLERKHVAFFEKIMENPIKMDDLWEKPDFWKHPYDMGGYTIPLISRDYCGTRGNSVINQSVTEGSSLEMCVFFLTLFTWVSEIGTSSWMVCCITTHLNWQLKALGIEKKTFIPGPDPVRGAFHGWEGKGCH